MAAKLSKSERRRAQRRGLNQFVDAERDRLARGVYSEDLEEHVEKKIGEIEARIAALAEELDGDDGDKVLDDEREEHDASDEYDDDAEAQADGFSSAQEGNEHFRKMREELNDYGNMGARVECQIVEDLASEGITKADIYEVAEAYEELQEELWEAFDDE